MDKDTDILMDERIESFLQGKMSPTEEADFKQELKRNPELRNQALTMASLIKGIKKEAAEKDRGIIGSGEKQSKSNIRSILWWACSAAAVFVIFFGIYNVRRNNKLDAILSPYYMEYDMTDISRGETDSLAVTHLYALFNQIQEKRNVSGIIKELEPIYQSLETDFTYYPYANDIAWNLALAYVKDKQIDKAITLLEKLKNDNPDTPISNKADELLNKLKEL